MFKKYGPCKDCGHKWKILKLGSGGFGGVTIYETITFTIYNSYRRVQ